MTERGPLPPDVAVGLTEQILRALGYAHRRGIVHRDVKPQNVIVDREGQAKVADFGIARAGHSEMTQTGAIVGTVQYLSPEQAEGQPGRPPLGPLLGRRRALRAADRPRAVRRRGADLDRDQARSTSGRCRPGSCARASRPRSRRSCMRALEKDPARRFQSAEEFIAALEPPAARRRARSCWSRRPASRGSTSRGAPLALVGVAARRCSRWPRSPSARTSCSSATASTCRTWSGRDASEAADIAAPARARDRVRHRASPTTSRATR